MIYSSLHFEYDIFSLRKNMIYSPLCVEYSNDIRSFIRRRRISSAAGGYHIEDISSVPNGVPETACRFVAKGTDIIEKSTSYEVLFSGAADGTCSRLLARASRVLTWGPRETVVSWGKSPGVSFITLPSSPIFILTD